MGDLKGITAHLDHVASLGVDGVWLSPFFKSPMKDFGYDVSDYCDVDPIFGTLADFDALVARAHALGLKVVIDQVFSHTSDEHPWFVDSRASRRRRTRRLVRLGRRQAGRLAAVELAVGVRRPGLDLGCAARPVLHAQLPGLSASAERAGTRAVQDALIAAARFWLDRGVDGFRLDAINFAIHDPVLDATIRRSTTARSARVPFDFQDKIYNQSQPEIIGFLNRIRALTDSYDGRFTVAEVGGDHADREMKEFTAGNDRLHSAYGFLYLYADTLRGELIGQGDAMWPDQQGEGWPSWTFSNHDAPRAVSRWAQGPRREGLFAEMALLLLMCLRGNVFVYQGEELGLPQAEVPFERLVDPEAIANWPQTLGRDGARTPMPWVASAPNAGFSDVGAVAAGRSAPPAPGGGRAGGRSRPRPCTPRAASSPCVRPIRPCATGGLEIESAGDLLVFRTVRAGGGGRAAAVRRSTWATRPSIGPRPPARAGSRRSTGPRRTDRR